MLPWKRQLRVIHRWLGIVLCGFFALWFFSGIFMMYVEFPQLTRPERLASLESLDFSSARLKPGEAVALLKAGDFDTVGEPHANLHLDIDDPDAPVTVDEIRLGMLHGEPVYFVYPDSGAQPRTVSAATGEVFERLERDAALAAARAFARRHGLDAKTPAYLGLVQTDQWTVSSAMNGHRPVHRVAMRDAADTEFYVSSTTGEVVRDSSRLERTLNYFAAVTHWLYPTFIRQHVEVWRWMVNLLSGAGVALGATGLWLGIMRLRRRRKPETRIIPYRGLMRWHHITGLVFGVVTITWVFSGLLSMNPGSLNPSRSPTDAQRQVYSGQALTPADFVQLFVSPPGVDIAEGKLFHYHGFPWYLATARDGATHLLPADDDSPPPPTPEAVIARAGLLIPDMPVQEAVLLEEYDAYWYSRNPERSGRTLPVIRVRYSDPQTTWFYIDPGTGQVLQKLTATNRLYRWLYGGLHSWDIPWLYARRPLWDICVIAFSLGGLALSLIGIVVSWRRLRLEKRLLRTRRRRKAEALQESLA